MATVHAAVLPEAALLRRYASGGYVDCYVAELHFSTSFEDFVEAFYTTWLIKIERAILSLLASKPSSDEDAADLARSACSSFAAWNVEGRNANQLLLADFTGRTRSWLMAEAFGTPSGGHGTRLYFGSAVVSRRDRRTGRESMGFTFRALLGFHKLYSRLLLAAACSRLQSGR